MCEEVAANHASVVWKATHGVPTPTMDIDFLRLRHMVFQPHCLLVVFMAMESASCSM